MRLRSARLVHFRNHRESTIEASPRANVFLGNNGEGKTNVLEAVSFLCLTKSFYAASDSTVVQIGEPDFCVDGTIESDGGITYDVRVTYLARERRKEYTINRQLPEKLSAVVGQFPVVVLSPENNAVTFGGPGDRRRFLDLAISQASRTYLEDLMEYRRILRQRNRILAENRDSRNSVSTLLEPWDETLIERGARIAERRMAFTQEFEPVVGDAFRLIAGGTETPRLLYESSFGFETGTESADVKLLFARALAERSVEERRAGTTLTGPHRDELLFRINELDLRGFASQGQHKTFLVALKLAEFAYLKERCRETPVLLLDDVLSELDEHRARRLLNQAETAGQTFITSTDDRPFGNGAVYKRFWIAGGTVREYEKPTDDANDR